MRIKTLLLTAVAAAILSTTGMAMADPYDHGRPAHHEMDRRDGDRRGGGHDRYWRPEFRDHRTVDRDRVFMELRRHHYDRFVGDPYWYQGRYVVRSYDRFGHVVFVEVNPYTGGFVGVIRF